MSYAGEGKGENKPQITVVISNKTTKKKKSTASIAMATGDRSRNLEERKIVKKAKLKSDIVALRKR